MSWEDIIKAPSHYTDAFEKIKNTYHQYWTLAYKLEGMGEAATLDGLVGEHIRESLAANKNLSQIVTEAKDVIENYLLRD